MPHLLQLLQQLPAADSHDAGRLGGGEGPDPLAPRLDLHMQPHPVGAQMKRAGRWCCDTHIQFWHKILQ